MFPACHVDHVVQYTSARYIRACQILDPTSAFSGHGIDSGSYNNLNNGKLNLRYERRYNVEAYREGWSIVHADSGYLVEHYTGFLGGPNVTEMNLEGRPWPVVFQAVTARRKFLYLKVFSGV